MHQSPNTMPKDRKKLRIDTKEFIPKPSKPMSNSSSHFSKNYSTYLNRYNPTYKYQNEFPRLTSYDNCFKIQAKFPSLGNINSNKFDFSEYEDYKFLIYSIPNIDDAHKSIKYGIFAGDMDTQINLSRILNESNSKVIVFLKLESDTVILGAAKLQSDFIKDANFKLWWNLPNRNGFFKLKWIFVKHLDLNFNHQLENRKLLKDLPDGIILNTKNGMLLLGILDHLRFKPLESIFALFPVLDQREDTLYDSKPIIDYQVRLQKRNKNFKNLNDELSTNKFEILETTIVCKTEKSNEKLEKKEFESEETYSSENDSNLQSKLNQKDIKKKRKVHMKMVSQKKKTYEGTTNEIEYVKREIRHEI